MLTDVAKRLVQFRQHARLRQEELERKLLSHNYRFSRAYISLCETGRTMPSLDFLRGCELVYELDKGTLLCEFIGHNAGKWEHSHHISVWEYAKLLQVYLRRVQKEGGTPPMEKGTAAKGGDDLQEQGKVVNPRKKRGK